MRQGHYVLPTLLSAMRLEWQNGKRVLICRRCVEQQKEDQQEMMDNIVQHEARIRRLKEHGE